jgi:hypothetical protein
VKNIRNDANNYQNKVINATNGTGMGVVLGKQNSLTEKKPSPNLGLKMSRNSNSVDCQLSKLVDKNLNIEDPNNRNSSPVTATTTPDLLKFENQLYSNDILFDEKSNDFIDIHNIRRRSISNDQTKEKVLKIKTPHHLQQQQSSSSSSSSSAGGSFSSSSTASTIKTKNGIVIKKIPSTTRGNVNKINSTTSDSNVNVLIDHNFYHVGNKLFKVDDDDYDDDDDNDNDNKVKINSYSNVTHRSNRLHKQQQQNHNSFNLNNKRQTSNGALPGFIDFLPTTTTTTGNNRMCRMNSSSNSLMSLNCSSK